MILQLRQIRFTDAITFMVISWFLTGRYLFGAENNPGARQVIGRELHCDLVTR